MTTPLREKSTWKGRGAFYTPGVSRYFLVANVLDYGNTLPFRITMTLILRASLLGLDQRFQTDGYPGGPRNHWLSVLG